jgi:hypothetical protein
MAEIAPLKVVRSTYLLVLLSLPYGMRMVQLLSDIPYCKTNTPIKMELGSIRSVFQFVASKHFKYVEYVHHTTIY